MANAHTRWCSNSFTSSPERLFCDRIAATHITLHHQPQSKGTQEKTLCQWKPAGRLKKRHESDLCYYQVCGSWLLQTTIIAAHILPCEWISPLLPIMADLIVSSAGVHLCNFRCILYIFSGGNGCITDSKYILYRPQKVSLVWVLTEILAMSLMFCARSYDWGMCCSWQRFTETQAQPCGMGGWWYWTCLSDRSSSDTPLICR